MNYSILPIAGAFMGILDQSKMDLLICHLLTICSHGQFDILRDSTDEGKLLSTTKCSRLLNVVDK